jgi:hypothetical protein
MPLTDHRTYDQVWDPQWKSSKLLLLPGEEADGSPHAIVLGNVDVIVDGANPAGSPGFRHVQQSVWDAHAQDAVWSQAHPDDGEYTPADGVNDNASVQGANMVEVLNVASDPDAEVDYAENRWNAGFRFGVAAASDCHFRELWDIDSPGEPTTHVFAAERSVRGILDGLRGGRTTLSQNIAGPFLTVEADADGDGVFEAMGGDEVVVAARKLPKKATLRVKVEAAKGMTVHVYAAPGRSAGPVATFRPQKAKETFEVPLLIKGTDHTWYRVEARSPGSAAGSEADPNLPDQLRAATSPIFLSVGAPADPRPEIALPTADTTADDAALVTGDQGLFTGFSDVAVDGKTTHVVAEVHEKQKTKVVYVRQHADGRAATKPVTLSSDSPTARFPRVVASGDDVWVVWQDELGKEQPHQPVILLAQSTDGGASFKAPKQLSKGKGRAIHPAIALIDPKHPLVAWSDNGGTGSALGAFDVYAQIVGIDRAAVNLSSAGKAVSAGTPDDSRSPRFPASLFPAIAVDADRRAVVTWQDDRFDPDPLWTGHTPPAGQPASGGTDPDNWQILAAVRKAPGRSWGSSVQVSAAKDRADRHPSVAFDSNGTLVAIWESGALQSSGSNLQLHSARSENGGTTWSAPEQVALAAEAMSQRARLSQDPDGGVRAVWYDSRSTDWRWKIVTSVLPAGDAKAAWSAAEQVTTRGNNTWPAVHQGVVVFTSDRAATRTQRDWTQQIYTVKLH